MPREVGDRAIRLALGRARERLHLVFFGGEPLLRWDDLVHFTETAVALAGDQDIEIRPSVTTNATLLSRARCNWLVDRDFVVAVSCDGVQEAHDTLRRDRAGRPSHERTWRGMQAALAAGAKLRVVLVLHPDNVRLLPASVDALVRAGATDLVVNPDWSADWSDDEVIEAWSESYQRVAQRYVSAYREGHPFWISTLDPKITAHIKGGFEFSDRCDLGRRNLVVAPSGNLYPCDRLVGADDEPTLVIGHVETGPDPAAVARLTTPTLDLPVDCLGCAIRTRCRNRCACANLATSGDIGAVSPSLCLHEQLCVRTADDAAEALFAERNELFVRRHYGSGIPWARLSPDPT